MNEQIQFFDPETKEPIYFDESTNIFSNKDNSKFYFVAENGVVTLMAIVKDDKVYKRNSVDGEFYEQNTNEPLKIVETKIEEPAEEKETTNNYDTYLNMIKEEVGKHDNDYARITFNISDGNPGKCYFRIDRVDNRDAEQLITEVEFTYNEQLKDNFITPAVAEYAKSGNVLASNIYASNMDYYKSDYQSYTENGNILNITGVDDTFASDISKTVSQNSETIHGEISEEAILEPESNALENGDELEEAKVKKLGAHPATKLNQNTVPPKPGFINILALAGLTGLFATIFILLSIWIYS